MHINNSKHKDIEKLQFIYGGLKCKCTSVHGVCHTAIASDKHGVTTTEYTSYYYHSLDQDKCLPCSPFKTTETKHKYDILTQI